MKRLVSLIQVLAVGTVLVVACAPAWAQINRGSLRGTVTDPQGAAVAGVPITITNIDTGIQQPTKSDGAGFYFVPDLVPGPYKVHIEMSGFVTVEVDRVEVKPDETATVDMQLSLGGTTQHVEVTAAPATVDTTASNFSIPVQERYMSDLPIEGRDVQNIVMLIPGVTQSAGPPGASVAVNGGQFGKFPDATHIRGSQLAVNGSQAGGNVWYLDGSLNSAEGVDNAVVNPAPDSVGEFQAITDGFAAEYSRTAGGVFSVVIKSGTNKVHGELYEYNRNSYFEARNPFAATDPYGKPFPPNFVNWNQFGGTIGGPVYLPHVYNGKSRTFFFAAWDLSFLHEANHASLYSVPTALMRQGNLSEFPNVDQYGIYDPMTTTYNAAIGQFVRQPFLNPDGTLATSLPANRLNPVAQYLVNTYPAPNFLDPRQQNAAAGGCLNRCNNYEGSYASGQTTHNIVTKMDHEFSQNNKLFVEWLFNPTYYSLLRLPWNSATSPESGFNGSFPYNVKNQVATLGDTHTFNPTLVNEFRFSYSRQYLIPLPLPSSIQNNAPFQQQFPNLSTLEFPPLNPTPYWEVGGYSSFGPQGISLNQYQMTEAATIQDDLTKVHSKHTIKTGFSYRTDIMGVVMPSYAALDFSGGLTQNPLTGQGGNGLAQFLLGAMDQSTAVGSLKSYARYLPSTIGSVHDWGFYVQDDYRVKPNLTVNIGLRYDIYGWFNERHDNYSVFNPNAPNPVDPSRLGAVEYDGTPGHPGRNAFPAKKDDFAPRLNFSYAPFADRKTVIRGGVDYVYTNGQSMLLGQGAGPSQTAGFQQFAGYQTDATGQGLIGSGVVPAWILGNGPVPPNTRVLNPKQKDYQPVGLLGVNALIYQRLPRDPNVLFWNFEVQRQLPGNFVVTAGYAGSKGTDLVGGENRWNRVNEQAVFQYKSTLNSYVPMPPDLVPLWGQTYFLRQLNVIFPAFPGIYCEATCGVGGASDYDGFLLSVERRFAQGLQFKAAYTFQKSIASAGVNQYFANTAIANSGRDDSLAFNVVQIQNADDQKADRSLTSDDIPQIFNAALTYELPFGAGKPFAGNATGVPRALISGWKFATNFNAQVGVPLNITAPCDSLEQLNSLSGSNCRPNLIGNPNAGRGNLTRYQQEHGWYNAKAFEPAYGLDPATVALATSGSPAQKDAYQAADGSYPFYKYGTAGLRIPSVRSPGFWDMDVALSRDFRVSEAKYFQLRAESYNALNHQSLGLPNRNWCLPPNPDGSVDAVHQAGCQFGWITGVQRDPRAFEFGLKFIF